MALQLSSVHISHSSQVSSRFLASTPSGHHLNGAITKERSQASSSLRRLSMAPLVKQQVAQSSQLIHSSAVILRAQSVSDGGAFSSALAHSSQSKPGAVNEGEERRLALERFKEEKAARRASMAGPPLPSGGASFRRDSLAGGGGAFPPPPPIFGPSRRESMAGPPLPHSRRESVAGPPPRSIPLPPKFDEPLTRPSFPSQHSLLSVIKSPPLKQQTTTSHPLAPDHLATEHHHQQPPEPSTSTSTSTSPASLKSDLKSLRIQELQLRFINAKMKQGLSSRTIKSDRVLAACAMTVSHLEERVSLAHQLKGQEILIERSQSLSCDLAPLMVKWGQMMKRHSESIRHISSALMDSLTHVPLINGAVMSASSSCDSRERLEASFEKVVGLLRSIDECTSILIPGDDRHQQVDQGQDQDQDRGHLITSKLAEGIISTLQSESKALSQLLDLAAKLKDIGDQAASLEAQACL